MGMERIPKHLREDAAQEAAIAHWLGKSRPRAIRDMLHRESKHAIRCRPNFDRLSSRSLKFRF